MLFYAVNQHGPILKRMERKILAVFITHIKRQVSTRSAKRVWFIHQSVSGQMNAKAVRLRRKTCRVSN